MDRWHKLWYAIFLSCIVWLGESLLMAFSHQVNFGVALWSGVPAFRLLLRLCIVAFLLFWGVMSVIRGELRGKQYRKLSPASRCLLFGDPSSPRAAVRLHYHCLRLAAVMGMRAREQERLCLLCYCHDLGLIGVPDEILDIDRPLTKEEQALLDRHIDLGAEIAINIPQLHRISPLILAHEEYYNGGGAKALYGRSIPLACRILKVVQMYDYFTHPHLGGPVLDDNEALDEMMLYSGEILDPEVLEAFRKLLVDGRMARTVTQHIFSS